MTGPQTEIETRLWCDEVARSRKQCASAATAMDFADHVLAAYRARYGQSQPAADDNLGRAAIEAMDAILSVMGDEMDHADKLDEIDRCIQTYIGRRWHIEKEGGE